MIALAALGCLLVLGAALVLLRPGAGESTGAAATVENRDGLRGSQLPTALVRAGAPTFELREARGGTVSSKRLRGAPYAVTFLYTQCPDVCPLIGQQIAAAIDEMGPLGDQVKVVAISVDPEGDTPASVRRWLARQRLPTETFSYAIGPRGDLEDVWRAYFAKPQVPGRPEESVHSAAVWLVDAQGRLRTKYTAGEPLDPGDLAHDLTKLAREEPRR